MLKFAMTTLIALAALSVPALADQSWNITEEGLSGIKAAQGKWTLKVDGGKISGDAVLNTNSGGSLTYKVDGESTGGVYTVKLTDRTDDQKDCVWTGKLPESKHGLVGEVVCGGKKAFIIRAGF